MQHWGINADRIHVVPEGPGVAMTGGRKVNLPDRYLLCVGTLEPRKNLHALVQAFLRVRQTGDHLVLVGQQGWLVDNLLRLLEEARPHVIWLNAVRDDELVWIYRHATALVYPSFYEGFGLPVLEAMTLGVPVLTSRVSSLPEVAGDAALFVDPHQALDDGLQRILRDDALRQSYPERAQASQEVHLGRCGAPHPGHLRALRQLVVERQRQTGRLLPRKLCRLRSSP